MLNEFELLGNKTCYSAVPELILYLLQGEKNLLKELKLEKMLFSHCLVLVIFRNLVTKYTMIIFIF